VLRRLAFAVLAAGLPGAPAAERFPREVDEGTTLRRTFESESAFELSALELVLDGEPHPAGRLDGISIERTQRIVVEDDLGPPSSGRPRRLVRYFEEAEEETLRSVSGPDGVTEATRPARSDLEGRSVSFELGLDEQGEYAVDWERNPGEDELLDDLVEDMDLRAFLPAGEVEEGDAWDVPVSAWRLLSRPGGVEPVADDRSEIEERLARELRENLEGEIGARFLGRREVDGATVAVVALEVALASEARVPVPTGDEAEVHQALRRTEELEGELLWDLDGGHLHSLELSGRAEGLERTTIVVGAREREQTARFVGTLEYAVRVERSE